MLFQLFDYNYCIDILTQIIDDKLYWIKISISNYWTSGSFQWYLGNWDPWQCKTSCLHLKPVITANYPHITWTAAASAGCAATSGPGASRCAAAAGRLPTAARKRMRGTWGRTDTRPCSMPVLACRGDTRGETVSFMWVKTGRTPGQCPVLGSVLHVGEDREDTRYRTVSFLWGW